jgi:D-sedoheptulose 7-phosphate isomerase
VTKSSSERLSELCSRSLREHVDVVSTLSGHIPSIVEIAEVLAGVLENSGTVWLCGNGGSAADTEHVMSEFVGRFISAEGAWRAVSLVSNTAVISSLANDFGYDQVFSRQLSALARPGDACVAISTSGESENVLEAVRKAKAMDLVTIGVTGHDGGSMAAVADHLFAAPSSNTQRIQEAHITFWHLVCELLLELLGTGKD